MTGKGLNEISKYELQIKYDMTGKGLHEISKYELLIKCDMTGKGLNEISKYEFVYIRSRQKKDEWKAKKWNRGKKKKIGKIFSLLWNRGIHSDLPRSKRCR